MYKAAVYAHQQQHAESDPSKTAKMINRDRTLPVLTSCRTTKRQNTQYE